MKICKTGGFTLLEIVLSIATITIIAGISIPIYQSFQVKNDLDITANTWVQTLRRAQVLSRAVDGDSTWGVKIQPAGLILFKGASYDSRDATFDEIFMVPTSISASGITEIVFAKFTGNPQATGTTTLTASTAEIRTININEKGTLTY
ncbi:MAG: hypothetical protein AAB495_02680 [Patescibacteria group bacterium]